MSRGHFARILWPFLATGLGCAAETDQVGEAEYDVNGVDSPVINGTPDPNSPAVVMLRSGSSGYCSGTLVSSTVVVTAAHCVDGITANSVGFGINGQSTPVAVAKQVAHPNWNGNRLDAGSDIAVLLLASEVTDVSPIAPSVDVEDARAGDIVEIVGYGNNTTGTGTGFGTKRTATLAAVAPSASDQVSEDLFVKVSDSRGTQTCNGDSGGPVLFIDEDGVKRVVGVTSFGYRGCRGGSFHTRVAAYADFLEDYLQLDGLPPPPPPPPADTTPPSVTLISPADRSTITAGQRSIVFEASDDVGVSDVTLFWAFNGRSVSCAGATSPWRCTRTGNRYAFSANIGRGSRSFSATATDAAGNATSTANYTISLQ